ARVSPHTGLGYARETGSGRASPPGTVPSGITRGAPGPGEDPSPSGCVPPPSSPPRRIHAPGAIIHLATLVHETQCATVVEPVVCRESEGDERAVRPRSSPCALEMPLLDLSYAAWVVCLRRASARATPVHVWGECPSTLVMARMPMRAQGLVFP